MHKSNQGSQAKIPTTAPSVGISQLAAQLKSRQKQRALGQIKNANLGKIKLKKQLSSSTTGKPAAGQKNRMEKSVRSPTALVKKISLPKTEKPLSPLTSRLVSKQKTAAANHPSRLNPTSSVRAQTQVLPSDSRKSSPLEECASPENSPPTSKGNLSTPPLKAEQLFAMAKMGYTQWEYGKLDRARAIFQTLIIQRPQEAWFRCALGSIYQRQNQMNPAIQQYNIALQLDPRDVSSRVNRGEIFLKIGRNKEALSDLNFAVQSDVTGKNPSALRAKSLLTAMRRQIT